MSGRCKCGVSKRSQLAASRWKGTSCCFAASAVATVESNPSSTVPCALWLISSRDEAALDIYEGWPRLYRKEMMPVKLGKRRIRVMVYVMNEGHPVGAPSCYYFNTILKGYGDFGLNPATLYMAAKNAIKAAAPYKPLY